MTDDTGSTRERQSATSSEWLELMGPVGLANKQHARCHRVKSDYGVVSVVLTKDEANDCRRSMM